MGTQTEGLICIHCTLWINGTLIRFSCFFWGPVVPGSLPVLPAVKTLTPMVNKSATPSIPLNLQPRISIGSPTVKVSGSTVPQAPAWCYYFQVKCEWRTCWPRTQGKPYLNMSWRSSWRVALLAGEVSLLEVNRAALRESKLTIKELIGINFSSDLVIWPMA